MPPALVADALRGVRIGVMRFATGFGTDAGVRGGAGDAARAGRDAGRHRRSSTGRQEIGRNELHRAARRAEGRPERLSRDHCRPTVRTRTLADLIAFNRAHADARDGPVRPGICSSRPRRRTGSTRPIARARETSLRLAGAEGIDRLLREHNVVALVGPTMPAGLADRRRPWRPDLRAAARGGLAAVAGYPHLTVPMGQVRGLPVGLSFIGPKWSDALILSLGYAYEQAAGHRFAPNFLPSIEDSPEVLRAFSPAPSRQP